MSAAVAPRQVEVASENTVIASFEVFRAELDEHNDRRERLIKASRDCTIASKRLIFLLHRIPPGTVLSDNKLMAEAKQKLEEVVGNMRTVAIAEGLGAYGPGPNSSALASTMENEPSEAPTPQVPAPEMGSKKRPRDSSSARRTEDPKRAKVELLSPPILTRSGRLYRYERNIGPGLEEFIEGASFLHFIEHGTVISRDEVQNFFRDKTSGEIILPITASTFLLGIADLTGELMRRATNNAGSPGVIPTTLAALRKLYASLEPFVPFIKDMAKKQAVTKQSMRKIEELASTLKVRSAEFASDPVALAEMVKRALGGSAAPQAERDE